MDDLLELGAEVFALDEIAKILAVLALILGVAVIIGGYFLNFSVLDEIGIVGGVILLIIGGILYALGELGDGLL
ncbi:MAG: hypothetical protein ABEK04_03835, partial [Candidatus Nanohalobium sp.]